jgi:steroid delta-isomerase-like uncharacterized protein
MAVDMKQASRRVIEEVFGKGSVEAIDELCDPSFRAHDPLVGEYDIGTMKAMVQMYRRAFPDLTGTVEQICAEGDTCCARWTMTGTHRGSLFGVEPTGKKFSVEGIGLDRFRNGKIVESFVQWDTLHFLQELGLAPRLEVQGPTAGAGQPQPHA